MKANEMVGHSFLKALIYGDSGAGKTCLAAQMPGPIEYWDFDGKLSSAVSYLQRIGKAELLKHIDVYQFAQLPLMERIPAWEKRTQALDALIKAKQPFPFKTVVLDSITTLSHHLLEDYIFRSQTGLKRPLPGINGLQDYGLYEKHMTRMLSGLLAQPINFIVLGHVDVDRDESTGTISRKPLCAGQQLAKKLPIWFDEVYVAKVTSDGKRVLQTQPDATYSIVRTQRGLAKEVPTAVSELIK